jgi:hypothetical protein
MLTVCQPCAVEAILKHAARGQLLLSCALIGHRRARLLDKLASVHPDMSLAAEYPSTGKECSSGESAVEVVWGIPKDRIQASGDGSKFKI